MPIIKLTPENTGTGSLILINADHRLKSEPAELEQVDENFPDILLAPAANRALKSILERIEAGGKIVPVSGCRSFSEQKSIYDSSLTENGEEYTKSFVALPGASEHQTGLAIDLALNEGEIDFICPSFPYNGICQRFRETAPEYGFVERYKPEKRAVTGIAGEEWHFRYVGLPHSGIMSEKNLCLEEYIEYLKSFTYPEKPLLRGKYRIFYVPAGCAEIETEEAEKCRVSGDNDGGFILTFEEESR